MWPHGAGARHHAMAVTSHSSQRPPTVPTHGATVTTMWKRAETVCISLVGTHPGARSSWLKAYVRHNSCRTPTPTALGSVERYSGGSATFLDCSLIPLAVWDASVSVPYDWVVSLDLDAAFNAPKTSIEEWLKQGISKRSSGGGGRGWAAVRAVPLSQIVDDDCATSHHGGNDLASGCVVVGKDLHGVAGVNNGVSFVRRSQQALELLAAWWSWPDRGTDGEFDARLKFKVDFPMEQAALNGNAQVRALTSPHSVPSPALLSMGLVA